MSHAHAHTLTHVLNFSYPFAQTHAGGIRSAWRASMSRYVLDDARALELLEDYAMYNDFPEQPGQYAVQLSFGPDKQYRQHSPCCLVRAVCMQVVTYQGRCEQFLFEAPETKFMLWASTCQKGVGKHTEEGLDFVLVSAKHVPAPASGQVHAREVTSTYKRVRALCSSLSQEVRP
eukprot:1158713-Pelagomonas_calceolata.AAC.8